MAAYDRMMADELDAIAKERKAVGVVLAASALGCFVVWGVLTHTTAAQWNVLLIIGWLLVGVSFAAPALYGRRREREIFAARHADLFSRRGDHVG